MFVVIVIVFVTIAHLIKKNKEEVVDEEVVVDDKTYTLELMIKFVKRRLDEITKINLYDIGLSEEELKRRKNKKYELKKALKGCTYGSPPVLSFFSLRCAFASFFSCFFRSLSSRFALRFSSAGFLV